MSSVAAPIIVRLAPEYERAFGDFLLGLQSGGDETFFHPHPFTRDEAARLCRYGGSDLYCIVVYEREVVGYGMLRGWDEGYETPSLGLAVDSRVRGRGLGLALMHFLHFAARQRGASAIRLTVDAAIRPAIALYEGLGYELEPYRTDTYLGVLTLVRT